MDSSERVQLARHLAALSDSIPILGSGENVSVYSYGAGLYYKGILYTSPEALLLLENVISLGKLELACLASKVEQAESFVERMNDAATQDEESE